MRRYKMTVQKFGLLRLSTLITTRNVLFEQQISILEGFLKDHVTLNTGVMMLNIQL